MARKTNTYDLVSDGWITGALRKKGETVALTEDQARYELMSRKIALPERKTRAASKPVEPAKKD